MIPEINFSDQHVHLQLLEPTQEIHAPASKQLPQRYEKDDTSTGKFVNDSQNNTTQHITKTHTPKNSLKQLCTPLFQPFTAQNKKNRIIKRLLDLYPQGYTPNSKKTTRILKVLDNFSRYVVNNLGSAFIRCRKIRAISKELFDMLLAIDHILAAGQKTGEAAAVLRQSDGYRTLLELAERGILVDLVERLRTLLEASPGRIETIRKIIRFLGRLCESSKIEDFVHKSLSMIDRFGQQLTDNASVTSYQSTPRAYASKHTYVSQETLRRTQARSRPRSQSVRPNRQLVSLPGVPHLRHVAN